MGKTGQVEFPPLFAIGWHPLSLQQIKEKCVDAFPLSSTRANIAAGLEIIEEFLTAADVKGQLWINGSFTTNKIDPSDADVVLEIDGLDYDNGSSEYRAAVHKMISNLKKDLSCETYVLFKYPEGHDLHTEFLWLHGWYVGKWGWCDNHEPKGIVTLAIGGVNQ